MATETMIETHDLRREILLSPVWSVRSMLPERQYLETTEAIGKEALEKTGRRLTLAIVDDVWADYLANVVELRGRDTFRFRGTVAIRSTSS